MRIIITVGSFITSAYCFHVVTLVLIISDKRMAKITENHPAWGILPVIHATFESNHKTTWGLGIPTVKHIMWSESAMTTDVEFHKNVPVSFFLQLMLAFYYANEYGKISTPAGMR